MTTKNQKNNEEDVTVGLELSDDPGTPVPPLKVPSESTDTEKQEAREKKKEKPPIITGHWRDKPYVRKQLFEDKYKPFVRLKTVETQTFVLSRSQDDLQEYNDLRSRARTEEADVRVTPLDMVYDEKLSAWHALIEVQYFEFAPPGVA